MDTARSKSLNEIAADIKKEAKSAANSNRKAYEAFSYRGVSLESLDPVGLDKTYKQTLKEINKRCKAMFDYCFENDLVMTDAHTALVLGISKPTLFRWRQGKQASEKVGNRSHLPADIEELQFIKDRAKLLLKWNHMAEMRSVDKISRAGNNAQGAIFMAKSSFGLVDSPQNSAEKSSGVHIENLILRAEQLKKAGLIPRETTKPIDIKNNA